LQEGGHYISTGWRAKVVVVALLGLSLFILGQLVVENREAFIEFEWEVQPWWFILAIFIFAINVMSGSFGWHFLIVQFTGFAELRHNIKIIWSSNLAHRIPGPVWYIASRAIQYEQVGISKRITSLLSAFEATFSLVGGATLFVLTLPFWLQNDLDLTQISQYRYVLLLLPICLLIIHPRSLNWIGEKVGKKQLPNQLEWRHSLIGVTWYAIFWLLGGITLYALIAAIHPVEFRSMLPIICMWALANTISLVGAMILPFVGLRELSIVFLISNIVPLPVAILVSIFVRILWMSGEIATVLISFRL